MAQSKNIPDQIGDAIQDALEHQDFTKIQGMVQQGVDAAAKGIGEGISQAAETSRKMYKDYQAFQASRLTLDQEQQELARVSPSRFANPHSQKISGILMTIFGGLCSVGFGATWFVMLIGALMGASALVVPSWILLGLTGVSVGVTVAGGKRLGLVSRFSKYRRLIGASPSFSLTDLAGRSGRTVKGVAKDLAKMIKDGLFLQAHVDTDANTVFLTDSAYQEFQNNLEEEAKKKYRESVRQETVSKKERPLTDAEQETLRQGRQVLTQIKAVIPGLGSPDTEKKAQAICTIAESIFNRAEQDPDVIGNLDQMVDYYLPLTKKLLDTYTELAAQSLQSESISTSRHEIEDTLGTLVRAFTKLHNSLFQEMNLDVSSDISVLNAVLAQDGLTDDPFDKKAGNK